MAINFSKYGVSPTTTPVAGSAMNSGGTKSGMGKYGIPVNESFTEEEKKKKGFFSQRGPTFQSGEGGAEDILPNVAKTFGNIPSSARDIARATIAPVNPFDLENPFNIGSNVVGSYGTLREIIKEGGFAGGAKDIAEGFIETAKKGFGLYKGVGEKIYENLERNVLSEDSVAGGLNVSLGQGVSKIAKIGIEDPLLIPSIVYTPSKMSGKPDMISRIAKPVTRGADTSFSHTFKALTTKTESQIENAMFKQFQKGVKPSLPGKGTTAKLAEYKDDVVQGAKTISENKPNLTFTDDIGDVVTGRNPGTPMEFQSAIEQTKATIFKKYDDLAKQGAAAGGRVKVSSIADELDTVINDKSLQLTNPRAVKYAEELKDRLIATGELDFTTAQRAVQNYNKSLEAFYRNPTYDTASQAAIDAMVANKIRGSLDDGISKLTGGQYQSLKNQYGSLKAIEKDVVKAALREARKSQKGLIDFTDIFSGGQVVNGIMTLNPGAIAQGAVQKGIAELYKYLNSPSRAIKKLFNSVDDLSKVQSKAVLAPGVASKVGAVDDVLSPELVNASREAVNRHFTTAGQVLSDTNQTVPVKELIKRTQINIVDGLKGQSPRISQAVSKLNVDEFTDLAQFKSAVDDIVTTAVVDDFIKNPSGFTLYRGEGPSNSGGLHFALGDEKYAQNFGKKIVSGSLPRGSRVKIITEDVMREAVDRGITKESQLWEKFFDEGYDAVVGLDSMRPSVVDVVVNPKMRGLFKKQAIKSAVSSNVNRYGYKVPGLMEMTQSN